MASICASSSSVQSAIPEFVFDKNGGRNVLPLRNVNNNKNAVSVFNVFFMSVSS